MRYIAYCILPTAYCLLSFIVNSQTVNNARSSGMGGASATITDTWSTFNNQAAIALVKNTSAAVCFEDRFFIKELSQRSAALVLPVKGGGFGLSFSSFGFALYSQKKFGLAFAKSFGPVLAAGVQLDYLHTSFGDIYGSKGQVLGEAGLLIKPLPRISIATHVYNVTQATFADYDNERVPSIFRIGLGYELSDKVILVAEGEKNTTRPLNFKTGLEYKAMNVLSIRCGMNTVPATPCFGIGLKMKGWMLDIASWWHPILGTSGSVSLGWEYKRS